MRRRAVEGGINVFGALALVAVALLVSYLAGLAAIGLESWGTGSTWDEAVAATRADPLVLALCQLVGFVVATGAGVLSAFGDDVRYRDALDVRAVPPSLVIIALVAGFAMQFPLAEIGNLLGALHPLFEVSEAERVAQRGLARIDDLREAIVVPLSMVVLVPVGEELLFRGLLVPGLSRVHGARIALVVSSLAFGAIHFATPAAVVYATLAGLALGWLRLRTGSLLPCLALHGAFNAVPIALSPRIIQVEGFNSAGPGVYHLPLALVLTSAAVMGACLYLVARLTEPPYGPSDQ